MTSFCVYRNEQLENVALGRTKGDLDFEPNVEAGSRRKGQLKLQDPVENMEEIRIGMPGVRPQTDDSYLCTSFQVKTLRNQGLGSQVQTSFNWIPDSLKHEILARVPKGVWVSNCGQIF